MILLITLLDTPWVYLSICEGSKTASGFTHFYTCLSFQCLGAFINIKVINNTLRISRRSSPILFLVFILKVCMMFCQRPKPYEFPYNYFQAFVVKSILEPSYLISSFLLILSVPEFRNKNADKRSEASKKQKEKRRKLNEESLPQKENDPADDAEENDD